MTDPILVIAEVGVNHDGSVDKACELIEAAAGAGANIVKFQTFSSTEIAVAHAPLAEYQKANGQESSSQIEMLEKLSLRIEDWETIAKHCRHTGIEFLSTGFDSGSIAMLYKLGMRRIKIPSGEITNLPLLRYVATLDLPMIVSTGMSTLEEVRAALSVITRQGSQPREICLLHCTSMYPAPPDSVNLRAMETMQREFAVPVGYSDHTQGWEISVAAVAMGASVIEKHLTYDVRANGPDHAASLEPDQFAEMVRAIRRVESALGHGRKEPHGEEEEMRIIARRSIVAKERIAKGQVIEATHIAVKRPGNGASPFLWDEVVGSRSEQDYSPDEQIRW